MRKLIVIAGMLVLLMTFAPVYAQDSSACGAMPGQDCVILLNATEATATLESASLAITGEMTLVDIPGTPDIRISMDGTGAFDINQDAIQKMQSEAQKNADSIGMTDTINLMVGLFKNINAELTLDISIPGALVGSTGLFAQLNKSMLLDMKMVDGVAYINFDGLDEIADGMLSRAGFTGWGGIDFVDVTDQMVDENRAMLTLLDGMMKMQSAGRADQEASAELMMRYVSIRRTDDGRGKEATFETSVDFDGMFRDDEFLVMMRDQLKRQYPNMTEREHEQSIQAVQAMFQDSEFKSVQRIDLKTFNTVYTSYEFTMDFSGLMQMMGQPSRRAPVFAFKMETTLSDFNKATVTAPRGARLAPTDAVVVILSGRYGN